MVVDDSMLRAYVDGELDAVTRQQVDTVLAHSAELRAQADALRASCLPYGAAFDAQALPPLPDSLQRQVEALVAVASAPGSATASASASVHLPAPGFAGRRRALGLGWAAAASFGIGLLVPWRPQVAATEPAAPAGEPWVQAIAGYQALYVRETVDLQSESPARLLDLLDGFDARARGLRCSCLISAARACSSNVCSGWVLARRR